MTMPIEVQEKLDTIKSCEQFAVLLADDTHAIVMGVDATGTVYGTHNNILITWTASGEAVNGDTDKNIVGLHNNFVAYKNLSMEKVNLQGITHNDVFYIWDNGKVKQVNYSETQYTHTLINNGNAFKNLESANTFASIATSIMISYGAHNEFENHILHNLPALQQFKLANDRQMSVVAYHKNTDYPIKGIVFENGGVIVTNWTMGGKCSLGADYDIVSEIVVGKRTRLTVPETKLTSGATVYTITPLFEVKPIIWFATQSEMMDMLKQGNIFIRKVDAVECAHRLKGIVNGN